MHGTHDQIAGDKAGGDKIAGDKITVAVGGVRSPRHPHTRLPAIERQVLTLTVRVNVLTWTTAAIGLASLCSAGALFVLIVLVLHRLLAL